MKSKNNLINTILGHVTGLVLALLIGIHVNVNMNHYCAELDADLASEALLMTVIADNGLQTPDTWASSSGVRLISSPNLGAFIYKVTGNMYFSIGLACCIMMLVLLGLMAVYYKQIGLRRYEIFASLIVLLSVSDVQSENQSVLFLWAAYYSIYFISLYAMLVFYNICLKAGKVPAWIWVISLALAIINGMEGLHAGLYCYFPMLGMEILRRIWAWKQKKRDDKWGVMIWLAISAIVSAAVPYFASAYGVDSGRNIRHSVEKFVNVVWPAMGKVVYFDIAPVVIWCLCALAVVGYIVAIYNMLKKQKIDEKQVQGEGDEKLLWGTLAPIIVIGLVVFSLTFTVREVAPRYFFPELFILSTGVGLFMNRFRQAEAGGKTSYLVAVITIMLGLLASRYYYNELIAGDNSGNSAEAHVATWMQDNGYEYGYAIFDNANTITVMSNNAVKVRAVNNMRDMEGCKWLSDASWYPPTKSSEGKTCYLVSDAAREDFDAFLNERKPEVIEICVVDRYTVYVLDHDYTAWE